MSDAGVDERIKTTIKAVRKVVEEPALRERLKSDDGRAAVTELGLPPSAHGELLQVVNQLEARSGAGFCAGLLAPATHGLYPRPGNLGFRRPGGAGGLHAPRPCGDQIR